MNLEQTSFYSIAIVIFIIVNVTIVVNIAVIIAAVNFEHVCICLTFGLDDRATRTEDFEINKEILKKSFIICSKKRNRF